MCMVCMCRCVPCACACVVCGTCVVLLHTMLLVVRGVWAGVRAACVCEGCVMCMVSRMHAHNPRAPRCAPSRAAPHAATTGGHRTAVRRCVPALRCTPNASYAANRIGVHRHARCHSNTHCSAARHRPGGLRCPPEHLAAARQCVLAPRCAGTLCTTPPCTRRRAAAPAPLRCRPNAFRCSGCTGRAAPGWRRGARDLRPAVAHAKRVGSIPMLQVTCSLRVAPRAAFEHRCYKTLDVPTAVQYELPSPPGQPGRRTLAYGPLVRMPCLAHPREL